MAETRPRAALRALYRAARARIDATPEARAVGRLPAIPPAAQVFQGLTRPMQRRIGHLATRSKDPVMRALAAATPHLDWRNSYDKDAFGGLFLHRSAWAELAGPNGAFRLETVRVTVGIWDAGLSYGWHAHGPEEVYIPLSGSAKIMTAGRRPRDTQAGPVHHRPWQPHRLDFGAELFVVLAVWSGDRLSDVSRLGVRV